MAAFSTSLCYGVCWIYTAEAFTTADRGRVFGIVNFIGRLGFLSAPTVRFVSGPMLLYGLLALGACFVVFLLPRETKRNLA